jgi:serine/threonine-protein kinase HipA
LAPAYDYVSTIVYLPDDDFGMNLAGTKNYREIDEARLRRLAEHARLPQEPVVRAAREMVEIMRDVWPTIARDLPMSAEHRRHVEEHMNSLPLFALARAVAR